MVDRSGQVISCMTISGLLQSGLENRKKMSFMILKESLDLCYMCPSLEMDPGVGTCLELALLRGALNMAMVRTTLIISFREDSYLYHLNPSIPMTRNTIQTVIRQFSLKSISRFHLLSLIYFVPVFRSDKAGKLLAEVLSKGLQGNRPVTLIGFSLGARVIFKCLQCLAKMDDNAGVVERVILLGAPISITDENWGIARKMVAGRFVNAYATSDWTLGVAFRASLLSKGLAGIQPVDIPGIENASHSSYLWTTKQILEQLELDVYYPIFKSPPAKPQEEKLDS
ncbi:hypothetical protein IFM89_014765 [Coptis chinensis]|uniref:Transmembrane and coiled-coil domain-containing protein 4 n=1 Tax=Coptis chinensis TaxID=261450 RepID=A0A835M5W2_9MAGN|nr:hypothetical protein IFM89_014765 [Coptis chinensis]